MIRIPSADTLAVITGSTADDPEANTVSFVVSSIATYSMRYLRSASTSMLLCVNIAPGPNAI